VCLHFLPSVKIQFREWASWQGGDHDAWRFVADGDELWCPGAESWRPVLVRVDLLAVAVLAAVALDDDVPGARGSPEHGRAVVAGMEGYRPGIGVNEALADGQQGYGWVSHGCSSARWRVSLCAA